MNTEGIFYRYQENLKLHAIRVMAIVEQVIHRLDEVGSVIKVSSMTQISCVTHYLILASLSFYPNPFAYPLMLIL